MRKLASIAAVVCLISCCGMNAFGAGAAPRFEGASAGYTNGDRVGQSGMNQECRATYGTTSHMCNADEFFSTAGTGANGAALWVQPSVSNCAYDGTQVACQEGGASTLVPQSNLFLTCGGWTSASGNNGTSAVYSTATGWTLLTDSDCNAQRRVACCTQ